MAELLCLLCVSAQGDYVTAGRYPDREQAWLGAANLGTNRDEYPYRFVVGPNAYLIVDAPEGFEEFRGRRVSTLLRELPNVLAQLKKP